MAQRSSLFDSLLEISKTLLSEHTLQSSLERVAHLAVRAIDGCDAAGVSVVSKSKVLTAAGSSELVNEVDSIQYGTGQGPCLQAIQDNRVYMIDSMADDQRWSEFAKLAAQRGVKGCLAFPLVAEGHLFGSLNLYSLGPVGFSEEDRESGHLLAAEAALPLANMRRYLDLQEIAEELSRGLDSQQPEALGVLMERGGVGRERAGTVLAELANGHGKTLEEAAREIVASASIGPPAPEFP